MATKEPLYVALDVEAAGPNSIMHSTLSIGACVVMPPFSTPNFIPFEEKVRQGLVFYAELQPHSILSAHKAMRVGCLHLECLEEIRRTDERYDPHSLHFSTDKVLWHMKNVCEHPKQAMGRFLQWLQTHGEGKELVGVVDTTNFDSVRITNEFSRVFGESPFGHKGLDLYSMHRGYAMYQEEEYPKGPKASLKHFAKEFVSLPKPKKLHKADQDAAYVADVASLLLGFEGMGW